MAKSKNKPKKAKPKRKAKTKSKKLSVKKPKRKKAAPENKPHGQRGYPPEVREGAYRLFKRGKTDQEVGELIGVAAATIGEWRKDLNWANRKRVDDILLEEIRGPNVDLEIASYTVLQLTRKFSNFVNKILEKAEVEFETADLKELLLMFDGRLDNVMKALGGMQANLIKAQNVGQPTKVEHSGEVTLASLLEMADKSADADGDEDKT